VVARIFMSRQICMADLDLNFVPASAQKDALWQECMQIALKSGSENQRYGSLVKLGGKTIGQGCNRLLKKGEPFPFKTTFFLHAERAAIGKAMQTVNSLDIGGAVVYVAGFLVRERHPLIRRTDKINAGSCVQCAKLYLKHNLSVALMTEDGWVKLDAEVALQNALNNAQILKERGISKRDFRREISL
jgi:hypothetical protein